MSSANPIVNGSMVSSSATESTPVWDTADPRIIYELPRHEVQTSATGPKIYKCDVTTGVETVMVDISTQTKTAKYFNGTFSESPYSVPNSSGYGAFLYWGEYGGPSFDRRYFGVTIATYLPGMQQGVMIAAAVYDQTANAVIGALDGTNSNLYSGLTATKAPVIMSYSGGYVIFT